MSVIAAAVGRGQRAGTGVGLDGNSFDFKLDGLAHVLEDQLLAVPIYQRSYSWQTEHIEDFWNDLSASFTGGRKPYFIGSIVLMSPKGPGQPFTVVDGQQRLATTAIFLAAVRDAYAEKGDVTRAGIVARKFLAKEDLAAGGAQPHLRLNSDDNEFYAKRIVANNSAEPSRESHRLIADAYAFFRKKLSDSVAVAGAAWDKFLFDWVAFLATEVRVSVITVQTDADAFLIYETLNDRGADLTIADLLKNYLFGKSGASLDSVRNTWVGVVATLDLASETEEFTTFIRHHWSSLHGATRERDLFKSISARVTTEQNALDFAAALEVSAKAAAALKNPVNERWQALGPTARANLETLMRLELEQNRPLLFAAMQHFDDRELRKLLRSLVGWSVRGLIVGGIGGGVAERVFCEGAQKVRSGAVKTAADVLNAISAIVPSDAAFQDAFKIAKIAKPRLARYILLTLERTKRADPEPELVPNANEEEVNLEHILPRSPSAHDWPSFSDDQRRDYLWRLGNLVPLAKGPNGRIGNKAFSEKKPILAQSQILLAADAGAEADWTPAVIDARQVVLAELAVAAWPR